MTRHEYIQPTEFTRAQRELLTFFLGESGQQSLASGLFPRSIELPDLIANRAQLLYRYSISGEKRREYGNQFWWQLGSAQPVVGREYAGDSEEQTVTQSMRQNELLLAGRTPTIDLHTHPKQFDEDVHNNFVLAQFPSADDVESMVDSPHIVAMVVRCATGFSCVLKNAELIKQGSSAVDLEALRSVKAAHRGDVRKTGHRLAHATKSWVGWYHSFDPNSQVMKYIPAVRPRNHQTP
ncbi:hypothetical protein HYS00_02290 [Candidatus Microgenomates bacterium]|nr:hypothetical protein [Candidatus Microgenomates bacterium]